MPPGTVVNPAANAGYSASTSRIISARSTPGSIPAVRQAQVDQPHRLVWGVGKGALSQNLTAVRAAEARREGGGIGVLDLDGLQDEAVWC